MAGKTVKSFCMGAALMVIAIIGVGCSKQADPTVQSKLDVANKANAAIGVDIKLIKDDDGKEVQLQGDFLKARNEFVSLVYPGKAFPETQSNNMKVALDELDKLVTNHRIHVSKLLDDVANATEAYDAAGKAAIDEKMPYSNDLQSFIKKNATLYGAQVEIEKARLDAISRQLEISQRQYSQLQQTNTTDAATFNAASDAYNKLQQEMISIADADRKLIERTEQKIVGMNTAILTIIDTLKKAGLNFD